MLGLYSFLHTKVNVQDRSAGPPPVLNNKWAKIDLTASKVGNTLNENRKQHNLIQSPGVERVDPRLNTFHLDVPLFVRQALSRSGSVLE